MKFEYLTVNKADGIYPTQLSRAELNALGEEGWELVSFALFTHTTHYVFKRPLNKQRVTTHADVRKHFPQAAKIPS